MNPIEIIFKAEDQTRGATESVKDALGGIQDQATQANDSLSSISSVVVTQAMLEVKEAAVDAFNAAADAAMEFVDAAAEAEMVGVRMEATIRALGDQSPATADEINALADELSKLTGFDDEALVEAEATMARIGSVSEENFERATRAAVDLAAATGMDLNTAFQQVAIAMEKGDFGRLARQIGDLPPEMKKAAEAAADMGDSLQVQEIILSGIEEKVSGVGEEIGETFTGQLNKAKVGYGNFQEDVGTPLLSLFTSLPEPVRNTGYAIMQLGSTLMPVIGSMADLVIATRGLQGALGAQGLVGALTGVKAAGAASFAPLLLNLGLVLVAVTAVVAVWAQWNDKIVKTNEEGQKAVKGTWDKFFSDQVESGASAEEIIDNYRAAQARVNTELDKANPIAKAFIFNKDKLTDGDKQLKDALDQVTGSQTEFNQAMEYYNKSVAPQAADATAQTKTSFMTIANDIAASLNTVLPQIDLFFADMKAVIDLNLPIIMADFRTWFLQTADNIAQGLNNALTAIDQWLKDMADKIAQGISNTVQRAKDAAMRFVEAGRAIVEGIWKGIQDGWEWLKSQISANMTNLLEWVKDTLGISSPSKLFAVEIGRPMAEGIGKGFVDAMKKVNPMISATLQPAPALARSGMMAAGSGGSVSINGNFAFYSPLTHQERRTIRRDQEETAQREMLRMLRR